MRSEILPPHPLPLAYPPTFFPLTYPKPANGSALVMLSWAALAVYPPAPNASAAAAKATRDDELSFACVLLALCLFLRWIGPAPQPLKQKRR